MDKKASREGLTKVGFGSIVTISITGLGLSSEETILYSDLNEDSNYLKVSSSSPIGKVIFDKPVGYIGEYKVNGNKMQVEIIDIR